MAVVRSTFAIWLASLLLPATARFMHKHVAVDLQGRQAPVDTVAVETSMAPGVLTMITPSPGAAPVAVTSQSQVVTSFVPEFTLCALPPIAFFPVSQPETIPTTAPWANFSTSIPPVDGECETVYRSTLTTVCATTLSGLIDEYPVTDCADEITFSSDHGFVLAYPTPTPSEIGTETYNNLSSVPAQAAITPAPVIQTLTTFYAAPWQELTTAGPPTDVTRIVCTTHANGTEVCIRENQIWQTELITISTSTVTDINLSTTIYGPSQVIFATLIAANVTEQVTTISVHTRLELEYETQITTTNVQNATVSTGPTQYETWTVEEASPSS